MTSSLQKYLKTSSILLYASCPFDIPSLRHFHFACNDRTAFVSFNCHDNQPQIVPLLCLSTSNNWAESQTVFPSLAC